MSGIAQGLDAQPEDTKDIGAQVRAMFPGAASIDHATERKAFEGERDREREAWERDRERAQRKIAVACAATPEHHENGDGVG